MTLTAEQDTMVQWIDTLAGRAQADMQRRGIAESGSLDGVQDLVRVLQPVYDRFSRAYTHTARTGLTYADVYELMLARIRTWDSTKTRFYPYFIRSLRMLRADSHKVHPNNPSRTMQKRFRERLSLGQEAALYGVSTLPLDSKVGEDGSPLAEVYGEAEPAYSSVEFDAALAQALERGKVGDRPLSEDQKEAFCEYLAGDLTKEIGARRGRSGSWYANVVAQPLRRCNAIVDLAHQLARE